jgi:hypothetical protein
MLRNVIANQYIRTMVMDEVRFVSEHICELVNKVLSNHKYNLDVNFTVDTFLDQGHIGIFGLNPNLTISQSARQQLYIKLSGPVFISEVKWNLGVLTENEFNKTIRKLNIFAANEFRYYHNAS